MISKRKSKIINFEEQDYVREQITLLVCSSNCNKYSSNCKLTKVLDRVGLLNLEANFQVVLEDNLAVLEG